MIILSIETSCDDTGISVLEIKNNTKNPVFKILANSLSSQIKIHSPYGGVYPKLAKREHIKNLPILLNKVLKKVARQDLVTNIDLITVTSGPGLEPALWTGITFAKELSKKWNIPVIPVNHMEGHILSVFAKNKGKFSIPKIDFPVISLLVSGGHTELVLMKDWLKYKIIGETLDDAAGEAFDKVARMLELPYPGGPEISKLAEEARLSQKPKRKIKLNSQKNNKSNKIPKFPRPMIHSKNFNFSFSGLKTAVLYFIRDIKKQKNNKMLGIKIKREIALEFENAVIETLIYKTKKAIEKYKANTLIVAGGVSANKYLKKEIKKITRLVARQDLATKNLQILFPGKKLTGDNSIMIGIAGYFQFIKKKNKKIRLSSIKAKGNLRL